MTWKRQDVMDRLRRMQGARSLRRFAAELGCSAAYLSDVYRGNRQPGPKLLKHLGLEARTEIAYVSRQAQERERKEKRDDKNVQLSRNVGEV